MDNVKKEIWKDIEGYEGLYQVSSNGQIRSIKRNTTSGKLLKQSKQTNGYPIVSLCKDNVKETKLVHLLVARHYIPNPLNLPQVNHINEDKTDNRVENLEWCTAEYNANFGTRNSRVKNIQLNDVNKSRPVLQYDLKGNFIKEWPSLAEIKRQLNISKSCISYVCDGKNKSSHNYLWKWK